MAIPFKSEPADLHQRELFPGNVFDLLPKGHDCFLFHDLFQQLDTRSVEAHYSPQGQHAYHPRQIVSILIYGYTHGVFSSRQLEKRCNEDLSFMYIAGRNCPNFRVLSDFRKDNAEFFQDCFKQTVQLALEMKLASLGHVSLDGSKFKANSSKHKAMSYQRLKEKEQALAEEIEALVKQANASDAEEDAAYRERTGYELPEALKFRQQRLAAIQAARAALEAREEALHPGQAIDGKKQISFADKEARIMGKKGDGFAYSYNGQISVDSDHQIIVGQHVSQNANDKQEVKPALGALQEAAGQLPDKASLDNGYYSADNLEALEQAEVEAYVAVDRGEQNGATPVDGSSRRLVKADFVYDADSDSFRCPAGQILVLKSQGKEGSRIYQGEAAICSECPYQTRCCRSEKGEARTINTDGQEALRQHMRERMGSELAKATYRRRKVIVEPVFGQLKNSGFRGFSLRGKEKVAGEFSLLCAGHNLKKMVKAMITGWVRLEFGKILPQAA